jgi:hypothetical protein
VDETFWMLGREHEADLEREAARRRLAASARPERPALASRWRRRWSVFVGVRLALHSSHMPAAKGQPADSRRTP